jgi:hypothetical protein
MGAVQATLRLTLVRPGVGRFRVRSRRTVPRAPSRRKPLAARARDGYISVMANGTSQAQTLPLDKVREIDALNLHPGQRETLEWVLINYPAHTVPEAVEHLRAMGGI